LKRQHSKMIRSTVCLLCILATTLAKLTSQGILNHLDKTEELSAMTQLVDLPCSHDYNIVIDTGLDRKEMADLKKSLTGVTEDEAKDKWMTFFNTFCHKTSAYKADLPECTVKQLEEYFSPDNKTENKLLALKKYSEESQSLAMSMFDYGKSNFIQKKNELPTRWNGNCLIRIDLLEEKQRKKMKKHFRIYLQSIDILIQNVKNNAVNVNDLGIYFGAMKSGLDLMCYRFDPIVYDNFDSYFPIVNKCQEEKTRARSRPK